MKKLLLFVFTTFFSASLWADIASDIDAGLSPATIVKNATDNGQSPADIATAFQNAGISVENTIAGMISAGIEPAQVTTAMSSIGINSATIAIALLDAGVDDAISIVADTLGEDPATLVAAMSDVPLRIGDESENDTGNDRNEDTSTTDSGGSPFNDGTNPNNPNSIS